jgi:hypothetical protein
MSLVHRHSKNKNRYEENADFLSHCPTPLTSLTPTILPLSPLPILTPPNLSLPLPYTPIQSKNKIKKNKNKNTSMRKCFLSLSLLHSDYPTAAHKYTLALPVHTPPTLLAALRHGIRNLLCLTGI